MGVKENCKNIMIAFLLRAVVLVLFAKHCPWPLIANAYPTSYYYDGQWNNNWYGTSTWGSGSYYYPVDYYNSWYYSGLPSYYNNYPYTYRRGGYRTSRYYANKYPQNSYYSSRRKHGRKGFRGRNSRRGGRNG